MDVYEIVTAKIVEELKNGIIPWKKPWSGSAGAVKHADGKSYSLLNQFLLGCQGEWISYNQAQKEGGRVKPGEKGKIVVFWKMFEKDTGKRTDDGEPIMTSIPYLKYSTVFEVSQCDGIKRKHGPKINEDIKSDEKAESVFANYTKANTITTHFGGNQAFYRPSDDSITVPLMETFVNAAEYYSTLFHEAVHSTVAEKRLAREGIMNHTFFGSEDYSKEELIAEIGAAMLTNAVGISTESSDKNNVAYIQNWLKALENDKRLIVSAASKADKAAKFILGEAA